MNHPVNLFTGAESVLEVADLDQVHLRLLQSILQVVLAPACQTHIAPQPPLILTVPHLVAQSVLQVMQVETHTDLLCQVQFPPMQLLLIHMAHRQHLR